MGSVSNNEQFYATFNISLYGKELGIDFINNIIV